MEALFNWPCLRREMGRDKVAQMFLIKSVPILNYFEIPIQPVHFKLSGESALSRLWLTESGLKVRRDLPVTMEGY